MSPAYEIESLFLRPVAEPLNAVPPILGFYAGVVALLSIRTDNPDVEV